MRSTRRIRRLLVANRGEIAVRVLRTARALGLRTVAVFSEADRDAPHVASADEALCIGGAPARDSYLSIDRLLAACRRVGADALHPGYGFLSENAELAARCADADVLFVGPSPAAIHLMGDKAHAKARMLEAGVPVVPGYQGAAQDEATLEREAQRLGLPLLIKAVAGGGGRGMRIVRTPTELPELLARARAEAATAFGRGDLLLERYFDDCRHVEVQVFGDTQGEVIHLGERDCSTQRRYQKVIEESPAPGLSPALRQRMGEMAVRAAKAIGYVNAGTIEFLLAADGSSFFFMEMNTRLQVEHPVTELVTGLDLVAWQLLVAEGAPLPLRQEEVVARGHAIEARLYAEDPYAGFVPQTGTLLRFATPSLEGVRVDAGVREGQTVSSHYDPLLAKVIAAGATREEARRRLSRALADTVILGLRSNRELLLQLLDDEAFVAGAMTTRTIEQRCASGTSPEAPRTGHEHVALAAALLTPTPRDGHGPSWRNSGNAQWPVRLHDLHGTHDLAVTADYRNGEPGGDGERYEIRAASGEVTLVAVRERAAGEARCEIDGVQRRVHFARVGDELHLQVDEVAGVYRELPLGRRAEERTASDGRITAPVSGRVVAVAVAPGQGVERGQCLVVLESMKMEHRVIAPLSGVVEQVAVTPGEQISSRQLLVSLATSGRVPTDGKASVSSPRDAAATSMQDLA